MLVYTGTDTYPNLQPRQVCDRIVGRMQPQYLQVPYDKCTV